MSEILAGQIGPETKYNLKFEGGKLVAELAFDGAQLDGAVTLKFDALSVVDALIDALEKAMPGDQTAIAAMLKMAVKTVAA